ncbi:MAG: ABC transporter substrate-binding protein [Desulfobaccales bacterium]
MKDRMHASKKVIGSWAIALMIGLAMFVATALPANAEQEVRFGYLVADQLHQYIIPIGIGKGYFEQEGVKLKAQNYASAGVLMGGLVANDIDVAVVGVSGAMIFKANGNDVVIIGTQNHGGSALVVDPSIQKFEDLKDQPVGDPGVASNHHTLLGMLQEKYHTHVKNLTIKPTDMPVFAKNKEVKGLICYEPWPTRVMEFAGWKRLFSSNEIMEDQQCCVLVSSAKYIKEHPDEIYKIAKVNAESIKYIRDHKDEAMKMISKATGLDDQLLENAYPNMIFPWPPRVNGDTAKQLLQGIITAKVINGDNIKPDINTWWNTLNDDSFEKRLETEGYIAKLEKQDVKP